MFRFPSVETADPSGLIALGGDLSVTRLKCAYESGIFPWPHEGYPLLWFAPPRRAILDFGNFKIPRRFQREMKKMKLQFRVDDDFEGVIRACAESKNRRGQRGTWITPAMIDAYCDFHRFGYAHSFEAIDSNGKLVGGLYGVWIGKFFAGESMFYHQSGASKFVLVKMVDYLKQKGLTWMDVQMMTPTLKMFGAKIISRRKYMSLLKDNF